MNERDQVRANGESSVTEPQLPPAHEIDWDKIFGAPTQPEREPEFREVVRKITKERPEDTLRGQRFETGGE